MPAMTEADALLLRFSQLIAKSCGIKYADRIPDDRKLNEAEQREFRGLSLIALNGFNSAVKAGMLRARMHDATGDDDEAGNESESKAE